MQNTRCFSDKPVGSSLVPVAGAVRVGPLASVPALVREFGLDPGPVFGAVGLSPDQFENPDLPVPYVAAGRLLAHCVRATGCEHFGLLVGERAGPSSLGVAGFILRSAPDVGTALRDLLHNLDLHDQGGVPTMQTNGGVTLLGYAVHQPGTEAIEQVYDLSIAVACNIMRNLCGGHWNPSEVLLSRRRPRDPAPYKRHFRAPLRFDEEQSAIAFPTRWLEVRPAMADPLLHQHLRQEANELRARRSSSMAGNLLPVLRTLLLTHACSVGSAANLLGMHPRTLNRRLKTAGTTYRGQLDAVRYDLARHLLMETSMPIVEIAAALGYADASAFIRAFRRWSGATPGIWRQGDTRGDAQGGVEA